MNANSSLREFARNLGTALVLGALAANGHGAPTALGTEPFILSGSVKALPNVMFVLDDSGSMNQNYLPDWAGPYLAADSVTVLTPAYRFFNGAFNGIAYNPGTYYRPPVMYSSTGALDTATYPSQTGESTATGGDATANSGSRNWLAVKVDAYGILSTATANLQGNAFSFTTVAGEYCDNQNLRTCTASATATGSYTYPAPLRWCTTSANAIASTATAGTSCQAANIANTTRSATITVTANTAITNLTVDGSRITSASTVGGGANTTTTVAADIAAKINACTAAVTGSCQVAGYSATSAGPVVTITAPTTTASTPVVTGGTTTVTAFSGVGGVTPYYFPRMPAPRIASILVPATTTSAVSGITVDSYQIMSVAVAAGAVATVAPAIAASINACTFGLAGSCTIVGYQATVTGATVTVVAPGVPAASPVVSGGAPGLTAAAFLASPRTATITFNGTAAVTNLTVDGYRITAASTAVALNAAGAAAAVVAQINACTSAVTGSCAVAGYRATSLAGVVTIFAPGATIATPAVTGGTVASTAAFAPSGEPGSSRFTVITPSINSYPYPGTADKGAGRTDCAGTTCTYVEEMTNYANWYTYYRTHMQMMKTAAGIAFASVDDQFRVGYYTVNNGAYNVSGNAADNQFLNPDAFGGTQKYNWYTQFYKANPYGPTPLRTALSNMGQFYAGKLSSSTLNGVAANDPVQYSCQQNFSILATDGYWNDATNPKQIDGTTDVGEQDHNLNRPYYDGGTQTQTISQTYQSDEQWALNTRLFETRTQQQQTTSRQLDQTVVTTDTYPWTTTATTLQTRTTPLNQTSYNLTLNTYDLKSISKDLSTNTFYITSTPRPLYSYLHNVTETTIPLIQTVTNITVTTNALQVGTQSPQQRITPLEVGTQSPQQRITPLQVGTETVDKTISALQKMTEYINSTTSPLQSTTTYIQSTERQLQQMSDISTDGGDTFHSTGWVDVSSCTVRATGPGAYTKNTVCQYAAPVITTGLSSCTVVAASAGPTTYTVALARACAYQSPAAAVAVGSCTVRAQSGTFAATQIQCGYGTAGSPVTGLSSCSANDQSASAGTNGATLTGNKVVCAYDAASWGASSNCTANTPASYSGPRVTCRFVAGSTNTVASCTPDPQAGPTYTADRVACAYHSVSWSNATDGPPHTCTPVTPSPAYSANRITCQYGSAGSYADVSSCTPNNQTLTSPMTGDESECRFKPTVSWATATGSPKTCTPFAPPNFLNAQITCRYNNALVGSWGDVAACTGNNQVTTSPMTGDMSECQYGARTWADATGSPKTCTPVTPSPLYSATLTTCRYNPTASPVGGLANQTSCTPNNQATTATMTNDGVSCAWDPAGTPTTLASPATCTWNVPATPVSSKTTCAYAATTPPITTATVSPCTPVAQSAGSSNGTVWSGPAKTCAYATAIQSGSPTTSCTAGTASVGPSLSTYTSCGYINGTPVLTGQSSCTYVADSTANTYVGPANACTYEATSTPSVVTTGCPVGATQCCTAVAQSGTFAAPSKTCTYAATGTTSTGVPNCTNLAQSSGAYPWVGPNVACSYVGTPNAGLSNSSAATCTAMNNSAAGPTYTGAKVTCTYNSATSQPGVSTCSTVAKSTATTDGTVYPTSTSCAYGSVTGWADATVACVPAAQTSAPGPYAGPARGCQYVPLASPPAAPYPYTATCTPAAQNNTNLTATSCTAGAFPYTVSTVLTTVNNCSTAPTSGGSPVVRSTATSCAYRAPQTVNSATCTPHAADTTSPYLTAVTCPVADTGWIPVTTSPVATSCIGVGTFPLGFDGTGKVVGCQNSDTTPYNFDYAFGPVPVSGCTVGTTENTATGVQTVCVKPVTNTTPPRIFSNTAPVPVLPTTCTATTAAVAPYYIWNRCDTTSTSTTVMGCAPTSPATDSPFFRTTSCADDGTGTRNTLADVAAYYYNTDLRTYALGNCAGGIDPTTGVSGVLCSQADDLLALPTMNNVPTTASDTAKWQHMTTFTLGLGASGYMKYAADGSGDYATVYGVAPHAPLNFINADPANGVCSWQATGSPCNWPIPVADQQTAIDDLWHAGVNGHGAYFSATDPSSLAASIAAALSGVAAAGGASASPTISNPSLTPGDSYIFSSTFTTLDWTGELVRRQLDSITGAVSSNPDWSVQSKLDSKAYTSRAIWTFDASVPTTKLKAFTSANFAANTNFLSPNISSTGGLTQFLCSSPDTCLTATNQDASHAAGANLVNFLRGDRSNEGALTDNSKYYRARAHVLGDMVNAQIVYVHLPLYNYADPGYSTFIANQISRTPIAYAGSNDGMLHAFNAKGAAATETAVEAAAVAVDAAARDPSSAALASAAATAVAAATAAVAADTIIGQEVWAYIPSMVMPNLYVLADKKYSNKHRYYVDGTPVFGDICTTNCITASAAVWKTILVGGLGHGGRGYYALDVTDPANPKALWEFTHANLGYSYGNPQITKLADGTWVVLVSSGYNNIPNTDGAGGDGVGRLFVLDAGTGTLIRSIPTGVGDTTTPSGLAKITAQVISPDSDNTVEAVYGGDLLGNVWRFDVNNNLGDTGYDAQLLAILKDGSGNLQPISTIPQVSAIPTTGERLVYVGTGTYLASSDATNTNQQSLYAIKDSRAANTTAGTAIFDNPGGAPRPAATSLANATSTAGFVRQLQTEELCPPGTLQSLCTSGQLVRTSTTYPVDFTTQNGWFIDLLATSERATTDPALALGELVINTDAPSLQACVVGGSSYTYFLNYLTGGPIGGGTAANSQVKGVVGKYLASQLSSSATLAITRGGKLISITGLSGGGINIELPPMPPGASVSRRTSWRELIRE